VTRYQSFDELLDYCALSAHPVGRIVLAVFGVRNGALEAMSDRVCAGLQLIEHWQDIGEDYRAGRIYLPRDDLDGFGVAERDLDRPASTPALRRLVAFEVDRAEVLLDSGRMLVPRLRGWARLAVAGYVAGGLATIDALRRPGADPLAERVTARRIDLLRHLVALLLSRGAR
jgi:phytoene/squalene synthetase